MKSFFQPFAGIHLSGIFLHSENGVIRKFTRIKADSLRKFLLLRGIKTKTVPNGTTFALELQELGTDFNEFDYEARKREWIKYQTEGNQSDDYYQNRFNFALLSCQANWRVNPDIKAVR